MNNQLPPITHRKLQQLQARRRFLTGTRALCMTCCVALLTLLMAVAIDYLWLLEDHQRWILSLGFYGVSAVTLMIAALPLFRKGTWTSLARLLEQRAPELQERVLPAVELSQQTDGSAAFRQQVIQQADQAIQSISIARVLPWQLIGRWLGAAATAVLVLLAFLTIAGPSFSQHLARVLLPAADLGRPSPTLFVTTSPNGSDQVLAPAEVIVFSASVDRPIRWQDRPVQVQLRSRDGNIDSLALAPQQTDSQQSGDRLTGRITQPFVGTYAPDDSFQFRFTADGAETPWQSLRVVPRPVIQNFQHQLMFPDYAKLPPLQWSATDGDLVAVAGSRWQLTVDADQPLSEAHLSWQSQSSSEMASQEIALTSKTPKQWTWETTLEDSAYFRVQGTSRDSGLDSEYSSRSRLVVQPDLPPAIRWIQPLETRQTTSSQALLKLECQLEDEFPLDRIQVQLQVDRTYWRPLRNLEAAPWEIHGKATRYQQTIDWQWDLLDHSLKMGQLLELRLEVVDRKGQTTYSPVLSWVVSGTQLDWQTPDHVQRRLQSLKSVLDFAARVDSQQVRDIAQVQPAELTADDPAMKDLAEAIQQLPPTADRLCQQLLVPLRDELTMTDNPVVAEELQQAIQWLEHLTQLQTPQLEQQIQQALNSQDPAAWETPRQSALALANQCREFAQRFQSWVEFDILSDLGDNLYRAEQFAADAQRLHQPGSVNWIRQQELLARHLREVAQKMISVRNWLPEPHQNPLQDWARWSAEQAERIEALIESKDDAPSAGERQRSVMNEFQWHRRILSISDDAIPRGLQARNAMQQTSGTADQLIQRLIQALSTQDSASRVAQAAADVQQNLLTLRRSDQYLRQDANGHFAADQGNAYRAIQKIRSEGEAVVERLQPIQKAIQVLQIDHALTQTQIVLAQLKQRERFERNSFGSISESLRQLDSLNDYLRVAHEAAAPAGMNSEDQSVLNSVRWSSSLGQVNQTIGPRRWDPNHQGVASEPLESFQQELQKARKDLAATFAAAREVLKQAGPTVGQLARSASDQASAQQQVASEMADEQRQAEIPDLPVRMQNQFQQQFSEPAPIQQLAQALQDQASSQDLMDQEQRENAKRSDVSQAIVQAVRQQVVKAMAETSQATSQQAAEQLDQLAAKEKQAAAALRTIAQHFDDPQTKDQDLLAAARELGALQDHDTLQQQYQEADSLAQLQQQSEEELLRQLEQELRQSRPMQSELSDISQDIAQQTQAALEQAASDEKEIQDQNENSDLQFRHQKQQMHRDLQQLASQSLDLSHRIHHSVAESAQRIDENEQVQALREAAHQLYEAAHEARRVQAEQPAQQLQDASQKLAQATKALLPQLEKLKESADLKQKETPHEDENQWRNSQQNNLRFQEQVQREDVRKAEALVKEAENMTRRDQNQHKQAQQEVSRNQQRLEQAKSQAKKHPDQAWAQQQWQDQQRRQANLQTAAELAEQSVARQQQRTEALKQQAEAISKEALPDLQQSNPAAEMARSLADRVAQRAQQLDQAAEDLAKQPQWQSQLQAERQQLAQAAQHQQRLRQSVQRAADDLQRAAEHEQRLQHPENHQQLANLAQQIQQTQQRSMNQAQQSMQQAGQAEDPVQDRQASQQQSQQIQNQLRQAQEQLEGQAAELDQIRTESQLAQSQQNPSQQNQAQQNSSPSSSPSTQASSTPSSANQSPSDSPLNQLSAQQKARLLDQLSQQPSSAAADLQAEAQALNSQNQSQQNAPSQPADPLNQAARQLASRMNQQRQSQLPQNHPSLQNAIAEMMPSAQSQVQQTQGQVGRTPVAARSVPMNPQELSGQWSQLRQQTAEDVVETQRSTVSPRYRKQVEAYFKLLSRQQ